LSRFNSYPYPYPWLPQSQIQLLLQAREADAEAAAKDRDKEEDEVELSELVRVAFEKNVNSVVVERDSVVVDIENVSVAAELLVTGVVPAMALSC